MLRKTAHRGLGALRRGRGGDERCEGSPALPNAIASIPSSAVCVRSRAARLKLSSLSVRLPHELSYSCCAPTSTVPSMERSDRPPDCPASSVPAV